MIAFDVLHADDSDGDAELTRRAFAKSDGTIRVHRVVNGSRAIDALRDVVPRLVLLDVNMPVMGGVETVRALRADPRLTAVPIVMLTASEAEREEAMRAGATDYLIKPVSFGALIALVEKLARLARGSE